jgi:glycosyltransferase involved in cell wall biosynthesis
LSANEPLPLDTGGRAIKISVISPSYNHARYIRQNLDSLLGQEYSNFEVILVNDASTDETHDIATEYAKKDSRLIYLRLEKNKGVMGAFNEGYKLATGDLIYGSASDDYVVPHFFEKVADSMKKAPQASGVFGQAEMIAADTGKSRGLLGGIVGHFGYVSPEICWQSFLTHRALIPGVSCVWRKDLVDMIGGYPEELGPQSDYFVNHALPAIAGVVFLPKTVAIHRMSSKSYNADVTFQQRVRNYAMVEKHFRRLKLHEKINPKIFEAWRNQLIENLGVFIAQRKLFSLFRDIEQHTTKDSDFWSYLPDETKAFLTHVHSECDRLESKLDEFKAWAAEEFKKETGV